MIGRLLYLSWMDSFGDDAGVEICFCFVWGFAIAIAIGVALPLVFAAGLGYLLCRGVTKWGNNYRELQRTSRDRQTKAMKELFKDDPVAIAKYHAIMEGKVDI